MTGICTVCKEWTDTDKPCCNGPVWAEGSIYNPEDDNE